MSSSAGRKHKNLKQKFITPLRDNLKRRETHVNKLRAPIYYLFDYFSCDRSLLQKNPSIILAKLHVRDIGRKSLSIDCGGVTFGIGDIIEGLSKSGIYASLMD